MPVNAKKVLIGTPDQLTTGPILRAPAGTPVPDLKDLTPASVTLDQKYKDVGYVNEDGITISPDYSTNDVSEWGGSVVRRILETFTGEISFTLIQTDENAFRMAFGDSHVTVNAASSTHGTQLKGELGAHLPDPGAWVFKMKDGAARMLICVPNGQVTSLDEITFNSTDPIGWAITLFCGADSHGESIYILTDDGQLSTGRATAEERQ